jgi:hypothetical protein
MINALRVAFIRNHRPQSCPRVVKERLLDSNELARPGPSAARPCAFKIARRSLDAPHGAR